MKALDRSAFRLPRSLGIPLAPVRSASHLSPAPCTETPLRSSCHPERSAFARGNRLNHRTRISNGQTIRYGPPSAPLSPSASLATEHSGRASALRIASARIGYQCFRSRRQQYARFRLRPSGAFAFQRFGSSREVSHAAARRSLRRRTGRQQMNHVARCGYNRTVRRGWHSRASTAASRSST